MIDDINVESSIGNIGNPNKVPIFNIGPKLSEIPIKVEISGLISKIPIKIPISSLSGVAISDIPFNVEPTIEHPDKSCNIGSDTEDPN
jgi:hypothetical protein